MTNCKQCRKETKNKKFCSRSCAAIYNNNISVAPKRIKKHKDTFCLFCGEKLVYRSGQNKFCSAEHQNEYYYKIHTESWLSSELVISNFVPSYVRRYLFEKFNNSCMKCGWGVCNQTTGKIPLEIHHIDGNSKNNSKDNLELLCPNCHSLTNTYGILNKGNGRKYYRQKYQEKNTPMS